MNKTRFLAGALACLLLTGCGAVTTEPLAAEPAGDGGKVVAYVPLDDRPDNVERVAYLAESLGYTLVLPEADWYRTRLDGQPLNENGTQYGDRGALYQWVLDQDAAGCDRFILSLDQLLSGGLVSSRAMTGENPVDLGGGALGEAELLAELVAELSADGDNRVWLLDTVMRLAPTVGYGGFGLNEYNALRDYGIAARPHLSGEALTVPAILADYPLGADGSRLEVQAAEPLPAGAVEDYLAARTRKLLLSDELFRLLGGGGHETFRVLVGIDDSSVEDSVQKNEIAYLRSLLRQGDALLSGVDDLAFKAMAKLYLEESGWGGGTADVRYFGGMEQAPACAYDYQPLTAIVDEHLDFFGLTAAEGGELAVLVLTQPAEEGRRAEYYRALIRELQALERAQTPVILIDAGNGLYGTAFHDALTKETDLGWLLSYAGFLDMAIVTGTALSHGVARYAFLRQDQPTEATERAFARTLADSVIKDFCYKNVVREDLLAYVRGDLGGNADNFWTPDIDRDAVLARLERGMDAAAAPVLDNLRRSNLIASLDPYTETGWGGIALENYRFPWDRAFEIGMDIRLGVFTAPHERVLGLYYR